MITKEDSEKVGKKFEEVLEMTKNIKDGIPFEEFKDKIYKILKKIPIIKNDGSVIYTDELD